MSSSNSPTLAPSALSTQFTSLDEAGDEVNYADLTYKLALLEARLEILERAAVRKGDKEQAMIISMTRQELAQRKMTDPFPDIGKLERIIVGAIVIMVWICVGLKLYAV